MPSVSYLLKRLLQALFVVITVSLLVSFAIRLTGDPAMMMMRESASVSNEDVARIREALGLNRPFLMQYADFMGGLLSGNMGDSFFRGPIAPLIGQALQSTLLLTITSLLFSLALSLPLGIYAALRRNSWMDQVIRIFSLAGLSFPNFWLGIMLMLLFSITLRLACSSGR